MKYVTHKHTHRYPGVLVGRLAINSDFARKGIDSEVFPFIKQCSWLQKTKRDAVLLLLTRLAMWMSSQFFIKKNGFVFLFTYEKQEFVYNGGKKKEVLSFTLHSLYSISAMPLI